ncbi:MAG: hypothetical protein LBJ72_01630 [Dysgonamonadaceae bacterium]|jgi:hypothetical protein|nr:hypothetical protein [Dysgonamonadaceae bacterium]
MTTSIQIQIQIQGGGVTDLIELFKSTGGLIAGIGFLCYGTAVVKKLINNHEQSKSAVITYIVALIIFLAIWELI